MASTDLTTVWVERWCNVTHNKKRSATVDALHYVGKRMDVIESKFKDNTNAVERLAGNVDSLSRKLDRVVSDVVDELKKRAQPTVPWFRRLVGR
jgi:chromosome segregation ATPase